MSQALEKKFSKYLKKTLRGHAKKQRIKYLQKKNNEKTLTENDITKVSIASYSLEQENRLSNLDVDYKHPEKTFSKYKYYKAMKEVPNKQKQALYLLVVDEFTAEEVARILHTNPNNVRKLKELAIKNFKKNLGGTRK